MKHSSQLQTLRGELDFRLSCSAGGSELTWAATSEVCACFFFLSVMQTRQKWGASGMFGGVLMRYARGRPDKIGVEAGAELDELRCPGRVTCVWPLEAAI